MKQISYYEADDGERFDNAADCQAYEAMAGNKETIMKWCEHKFGDRQGQATNALNKIVKWEIDRASVLGHTYAYPVLEESVSEPQAEAA